MKKINFSLLISCLLLVMAVWLKAFEPGFIVDFENRTFDLYQHITPRAYEHAPVRIVDIDDASLARLGQWPWPRTLVASLVDKLQADGASTIAFDIVFAEPDRTSPKQMLALWGKKSLERTLGRLPDHDDVLAHSIAHAPVVTGFVLTQDESPPPLIKSGFSFVGDNPLAFVAQYSGTVTALPILQLAAKGNGALNNQPDRDGISRHVPLVLRMGDHLYPSLALEALRVAQGAGGTVVKSVGASGEYGTVSGITAVKTGNIVIPTDKSGKQWIYFTKTANDRYLSAWQVLDGTADKEKIAGNIVLIGTSAAGLKDIRATPNNPAMPGVEIFAQGLEQALLGQTLSRPDWVRGAEICLMVIAGLLLLVMNYFLSPLWGLYFVVIILTGTALVSWVSFSVHHILVEPVMPMLTVVLLYISDSVARYIRTERERIHIRNAFAQYMSPELVRQLAGSPEKLVLGGENRIITVMFCDMQNFTSTSENLPPMELTRLISRFLTPITEQVLAHNGTVDKYIGDNVMAFWNAPLLDEQHAVNAAKAALGMRLALQSMNAQEAIPLRASISINTSECCVGNMGTAQRFNYSALGDGVNVASRLEGQCGVYGVDIIVGEETAKALHNFALLELDLIRVKGKTSAVRMFSLLGDKTMARDTSYLTLNQQHQAMLTAYRNSQWDMAEKSLKECIQTANSFVPMLSEKLYALFAKRIVNYRTHPPADDWGGVHDAREK